MRDISGQNIEIRVLSRLIFEKGRQKVTESNETRSDDESIYRIGAVCRLTGISQHVLRVWEKRYAVVQPNRSESGRRLYHQADVDRLMLLKSLVDSGQAIGSIAELDDAELERRIGQVGATLRPARDGEKPALALIGKNILETGRDCASSSVFNYLGQFDDIEAFADGAGRTRLDVAVIEWPNLHPDSLVEVTRLGNRLNARHLVLVYDFAPRRVLKQCTGDRITALRSPMDIAALEAIVAWRFGQVVRHEGQDSGSVGPAPARLFNDLELTQLAAQSTTIACECPMHLAQLISKLVQFEAYSAECESRNSDDAALHAYLHNTTSRARSMMESALMRVVELENLSSLLED